MHSASRTSAKDSITGITADIESHTKISLAICNRLNASGSSDAKDESNLPNLQNYLFLIPPQCR